jgi:hypothetical protein
MPSVAPGLELALQRTQRTHQSMEVETRKTAQALVSGLNGAQAKTMLRYT